MNQGQKPSTLNLNWPFMLGVLLICLAWLGWVWQVSPEFVRNDDYRFIALFLAPAMDGSGLRETLFANRTPSLVIPALYLINAALFDLDQRVLAVFGALCSLLLAILLLREFRMLLPDNFNRWLLVPVFLLLLVLSPGPMRLQWPLIMSQYSYLLLLPILSALAWRALGRDDWTSLLQVVLAGWLACVLNFTYARLILAAIAAGMVLLLFISAHYRQRLYRALTCVLALAGGLALGEVTFTLLASAGFEVGSIPARHNALSRLLEAGPAALLKALGAGGFETIFAARPWLREGMTGLTALCGWGLLAAYLGTLWFMQRRGYQRLALLFSAMLCMVVINSTYYYVFRMNAAMLADPIHLVVPRYGHFMRLVGVMAIMFWLVWLARRPRWNILAPVLGISFIALFCIDELRLQRQLPVFEQQRALHVAAMREQRLEDLRGEFLPFNPQYQQLVMPGLEFLDQQQLNVFAKDETSER